MKIFYTVTITGNQHESRERATDNAPAFCCNEMYNAWGYVVIFDPQRQVVDLTDPGYDDGEPLGGPGLRFCPWCSQPIEVEHTGTKDKRITACAAELKGVSRYLEAEGRKAFCSSSPLPGGLYCGRHKHLEEGADTKEFCGLPVVEDDRLDPDEGVLYPLKRTCKCDPATLVRIVLQPRPGVQCTCGAMWTMAEEAEAE